MAEPSPLQSLVGREVTVHVNETADGSGARVEYTSGVVRQVTDGWLVLAARNDDPVTPNQWISTAWIKWVGVKNAGPTTRP